MTPAGVARPESRHPEAVRFTFTAAVDALLLELRAWQRTLPEDIRRATDRRQPLLVADLQRLADDVDRVVLAARRLTRAK
jgi:hypothetical protein